MRTYNLAIVTDNGETVVARWTRLDAQQMLSIVTTIVPARGTIIEIRVEIAEDEK